MNYTAREIKPFDSPSLGVIVCQALCLAVAGALLGIAPEAARLLSWGGKGWAFSIACLLVCVSILIKGAVAHVAHASPVSSMVCSFWAGGALLAMSITTLVAPPIEYRSQLTVQMVLGLHLVVFPFANMMEERKRRPAQ